MRDKLIRSMLVVVAALFLIAWVVPAVSFAEQSSGFELIEERVVDEIASTVRMFEHTKTGARLIHIDNDDDNKMFAIGFRTRPENSTGVAHILEHSLLCGSEDFPVKGVITELGKGSLSTFVNAMTSQDQTVFPVATRNDQEFRNMMHVYLDGVFHPTLENDPRIFMQEGWHYELADPEAKLIYNGIVYNEMKGNYSNPERLLFQAQQESLFPDTPYRHDSGGNPDVIPELTYEELLDFYHRYYHPSNSYIYLYGDLDLDATLAFLNDEYLSAFSAQEVDSAFPIQAPFAAPRKVNVQYSVSPNESVERKTYLSKNYVVGRITDKETLYALSILGAVLVQSEASPLKRALIDAGVAQNVSAGLQTMLQPVFSVKARNANKEDAERFDTIIDETLRSVVQTGLDRKLLEATINSIEFSLRKQTTGAHRGLEYLYSVMDFWIHGGDPISALEFNDVMKKIRDGVDTGYFEALISQYLLNNPHSSLVVLEPAAGLAEKKAAEVEARLAEYKASLSSKEIEAIVDATRNLKEWQAIPNSPEALASIPSLRLQDLKTTPEKYPMAKEEINGVTLLHHPYYTNKIAYVDLYFDTTTVPQEKLLYLNLLARALGRVDTKHYAYTELDKEVGMYTGGIGYQVGTYTEYRNGDLYYPKLVVVSQALTHQLPKLLNLMGEVIGTSKFDDPVRLKQIIDEDAVYMRSLLTQAGHYVALSRLLSYLSPNYQYEEQGLLPYYWFISDLQKNFDAKSDEIVRNLQEVAELVFNQNGLVVSVVAEESDYAEFKAELPTLLSLLGDRALPHYTYDFAQGKQNEAFVLPSQVQYVAKGFNYVDLGYDYTGKIMVMRNIVENDYLWNRIRVQGGAYGAMAMNAHWGDFWFVSYRDPNLAETLKAYDDTTQFLKSFAADEREMTRYIIGTMSQADPPMDPASRGRTMTTSYLQNSTYEDRAKLWSEILSTTAEDIRDFGHMMESGMQKNLICVVGGPQKVEANQELFSEIVNIFE